MTTWLITGCSSGIGRGIAKAVLKHGDNAVVTARNISTVTDIVENYPDTAIAVPLDITNKESIAGAVKAAADNFGGVDILVNNAGYGYRSSVEEGEEESVNLLFNTNFFGPIELIKQVLPYMRAQKNGAILNVSSIAAARSGVGSGYYAASKAALELMTDGLMKEVAPLGIKVMTVEPGAFRTKFYDTSLKGTQKQIEDYADTAWKTRKENIVDNQDQPGDPDKAGEVIYETMQKETLPKRLLLGSDAVKIVSAEMKERLQEIEDWSAISTQTDY
ncbi:MAG: SDR family NAD(P)-dependent oxidoreductase [Trichococcus flocculiformis]|uniref:Short-chain dehydrogenase/reductase sdr n=3 Tax=Trichococcus TaxID=82802 RepID=A0A1W1IHF9_9LACT|nr:MULTISPECIES: oxidoreductase [Trichococcus]NLD31413.1 SDR family NAD(P)-dependent oxidoreductase [Trichococcus flocculiformis]SFE52795.1 Short-chain dehydrogenase [Trichococcus pasteurii]SLM52420.1 short-chain dehydrogenase/reductase sdr [Trichococcus pasteurii]SSB93301.1 short-chain dehydrogenase/reductase sdr [Trichococcus pasteurii]SYZ80082.1 short-chain dehydrogenase/reductase sdr [Trichococcus shcherbakoviae]